MDENTKAIVASNLTVAYYQVQNTTIPPGQVSSQGGFIYYSEGDIFKTYESLLNKLSAGIFKNPDQEKIDS